MFAGSNTWGFPTCEFPLKTQENTGEHFGYLHAGSEARSWDSCTALLRQACTDRPSPFNLLAATEDGPEPGGSSDVEDGTSQAHHPHTSATFTGSGERTLRSLTNASTTSGDVGHSVLVPRETESATQHGNVTVTGDTHLASGSLAASPALGGEERDLCPHSFSSPVGVCTVLG